MGMFSSGFFGGNGNTARTSDPYLAEFFAGRGFGSLITAESAMSNLGVVAACVNLRAQLLASSSLHVFVRGPDGGRSRADDMPLYDVLHGVTNPTQSAFEFRELMIRDLDLCGNGYSQIERDDKGDVVALYRLDPAAVMVERLPNGRLRYKSGGITYLQDDVLHVRGPSKDGILGQSPLSISRGMFGLAIKQAENAVKVSDNTVKASGLLTFTNPLGDKQRQSIRESMASYANGGANSGGVLVMDGGPKFDGFPLSPEDAQFLQSRKLTNEDCARVFGVPPTCVGITDKATYSNVEQEARALVQNALGPLAARIEAAMMRCLLSPEERKTLYIEHDLSSLLRGDVATRFEAYRIAREIGVYSANDIRKKENEPPIKGGDTYHMPVNWAELGTKPEAQG